MIGAEVAQTLVEIIYPQSFFSVRSSGDDVFLKSFFMFF